MKNKKFLPEITNKKNTQKILNKTQGTARHTSGEETSAIDFNIDFFNPIVLLNDLKDQPLENFLTKSNDDLNVKSDWYLRNYRPQLNDIFKPTSKFAKNPKILNAERYEGLRKKYEEYLKYKNFVLASKKFFSGVLDYVKKNNKQLKNYNSYNINKSKEFNKMYKESGLPDYLRFLSDKNDSNVGNINSRETLQLQNLVHALRYMSDSSALDTNILNMSNQTDRLVVRGIMALLKQSQFQANSVYQDKSPTGKDFKSDIGNKTRDSEQTMDYTPYDNSTTGSERQDSVDNIPKNVTYNIKPDKLNENKRKRIIINESQLEKIYQFVNPDVDSVNEDDIKGGKADKLSIDDIVEKHKTTFDHIKEQLNMGIKVEMEHTDDKDKAKEIAMDHLAEDSDYYTKLKKVHKD